MIVVDPLATASGLIDQGNLVQADIILTAYDQASADNRSEDEDRELIFLRARILAGRGQHGDAEDIFRTILAHRPDLVRVRLELALVLFLQKKDGPAEREFQFVAAGDLPDMVRARIRRFLAEIVARKIWRFRVGFSLAPDSNINTATSSEVVDIFGLSFTLDEEARAKSGVGFVLSGGLDFTPVLSRRSRFTLSLDGQRTEYGSKDFDDTIISVSLGPKFLIGERNHIVGFGFTAFRRWFGTSGFNYGFGGELTGSIRLSARVKLDTKLAVQRLRFDSFTARNGTLFSFNTVLQYALSQNSALQGRFGIIREQANLKSQRNTAFRLALTYLRELPYGLTFSGGPEFTYRPFGDAPTVFGDRRIDYRYAFQVSLSKRDIEVMGFSPQIQYLFAQNKSSITLFEYSRHRVRFGLFRDF